MIHHSPVHHQTCEVTEQWPYWDNYYLCYGHYYLLVMYQLVPPGLSPFTVHYCYLLTKSLWFVPNYQVLFVILIIQGRTLKFCNIYINFNSQRYICSIKELHALKYFTAEIHTLAWKILPFRKWFVRNHSIYSVIMGLPRTPKPGCIHFGAQRVYINIKYSL